MSAQLASGPSDTAIQCIADRLLKNFGSVKGTQLADAVAAPHPMDDDTYWAIRPRVFAIAEATNERTVEAAVSSMSPTTQGFLNCLVEEDI